MRGEDLTPEECRRQAIAWRAKAAHTSDPTAKENMLEVAAEYDRLADTLAVLPSETDDRRH